MWIAGLDSGADTLHPDLIDAICEKESFVHEDPLFDLEGRGTHCAGIIAGSKWGVASGAKLYIGKVYSKNRPSGVESVVNGIRWAVERKVDIISLSLTFKAYDKRLAAGNAGSLRRHNMGFPATMGSVIRVGSIGHTGASLNSSSIGGSHIDVAAFGEHVLSTWPIADPYQETELYRSLSGTSMATSLVTGVCALLLAYDRSRIRRIVDAHCMKDLLGKLTHNPTMDPSKGRGTIDLEYILDVPELFD
jgi:subtilisin family serine protease